MFDIIFFFKYYQYYTKIQLLFLIHFLEIRFLHIFLVLMLISIIETNISFKKTLFVIKIFRFFSLETCQIFFIHHIYKNHPDDLFFDNFAILILMFLLQESTYFYLIEANLFNSTQYPTFN